MAGSEPETAAGLRDRDRGPCRRSSVYEGAAALDVGLAFGATSTQPAAHGRELWDHLVATLSRFRLLGSPTGTPALGQRGASISPRDRSFGPQIGGRDDNAITLNPAAAVPGQLTNPINRGLGRGKR